MQASGDPSDSVLAQHSKYACQHRDHGWRCVLYDQLPGVHRKTSHQGTTIKPASAHSSASKRNGGIGKIQPARAAISCAADRRSAIIGGPLSPCATSLLVA